MQLVLTAAAARSSLLNSFFSRMGCRKAVPTAFFLIFSREGLAPSRNPPLSFDAFCWFGRITVFNNKLYAHACNPKLLAPVPHHLRRVVRLERGRHVLYVLAGRSIQGLSAKPLRFATRAGWTTNDRSLRGREWHRCLLASARWL